MRRPLRLYRPFSVALALVVLALALRPAAGLARGNGLTGDETSGDTAVLDDVATTEVIGDVSTALVHVFSYAPDDVAATGQAAGRELSGRALEEYRRLFAQVRQQAPAQRVTLATRVVRAGVVSLTGDTARLLVFLDQTATRAGGPDGTPAAAQLMVTAHRDRGHWTITGLTSA
ncbi:hypothetical protein [Actinomadura mexicana]|uniref:Mce-associated membrane protein n=1 Tax=Actinomadura mexicana TaxID=134959 RepID=A0A239CSR0_9ACTN|nr:hypothetical protein [Actinomadura mexicana]SNS22554.1 Mce-associated membrane protein [Actinomadura mexicana]